MKAFGIWNRFVHLEFFRLDGEGEGPMCIRYGQTWWLSVLSRYGDGIVMCERMPELFSAAMGQQMYTVKLQTMEEVKQDGRFYDYQDFDMVGALSSFIDKGKIRLVCVDSIDRETWSDTQGDYHRRIELHERWYHYIVDELIPEVRHF